MKTFFTIPWFIFKQMRRGIVFFAIGIFTLSALQGIGIYESVPDANERKQLVGALQTNPSINLFYGETEKAYEPAGYMYYRAGVMALLIASLWGLLFSTRMLRGQEEEGRAEILLSGQTTQTRLTVQILLGIFSGFVVAFLIIFAALTWVGQLEYMNMDAYDAAYYTGCIVIISAFFASLGAFISQLVDTRRKAVFIGSIFLAATFAMRAFGNVSDSLYWLKDLSPFGWIDQAHPVYDHQPLWLGITLLFTTLLSLTSILLANRRDLGESYIKAKDYASSHLQFLSSSMGLSFRLTIGVIIGWAVAVISMTALTASVAKTAVDALKDASSIQQSIEAVAGTSDSDMALVFISIGGMISATILMAMIAWGVGNIRNEEAKNLADNLFVRKVSRSRWLTGRAFILIGAAVVICLSANLATWWVAKQQGIDIELSTLLVDGLNIMAPISLVLGLGVAIFGIAPRLATWILYFLIAWSFVTQMITALLDDKTTSDIVSSTSLLQSIALVPVDSPDWKQF